MEIRPIDPSEPPPLQTWDDFISELEHDLFQEFLEDKLFTSLGLKGASFEEDEWAEITEPYEEAYANGNETIRAEFNEWFRLTNRARCFRRAMAATRKRKEKN